VLKDQGEKLAVWEARSADGENAFGRLAGELESHRAELKQLAAIKSALEVDAAELKAFLLEKSRRVTVLETELTASLETVKALEKECRRVSQQASAFEAELKEVRENQGQARESLRTEFAALASKLLEERGMAFAEQNRQGLDALLKPLGERLRDFQQRVEDVYGKEADQRLLLKKEIGDLLRMNQQLGQEANQLAQALKGQSKTLGNWGELILERVLEASGLEKGRDFTLQESFVDEDGRRSIPDAIIRLPGERRLVVDSKMSLASFVRHGAAVTPEQVTIEALAHAQSVRKHIDDLSKKRYQDLPGEKSPDFVFLFMPSEPALSLALLTEPTLFDEAFGKKVILTSPSTLMAGLRLVFQLWQQETQNRNAAEVARQAGGLHDDFIRFLEELDGVGAGLDQARARYEKARKKLSEGKGNLVRRVDNLKKLGAKADKELPTSWQDSLSLE
jgi:DNA recombination protein RmuC